MPTVYGPGAMRAVVVLCYSYVVNSKHIDALEYSLHLDAMTASWSLVTGSWWWTRRPI
jgi:hypothetical protein